MRQSGQLNSQFRSQVHARLEVFQVNAGMKSRRRSVGHESDLLMTCSFDSREKELGV